MKINKKEILLFERDYNCNYDFIVEPSPNNGKNLLNFVYKNNDDIQALKNHSKLHN